MDNDVTLVINLSAGDELYAYTVVEALSAAHRHTVTEVVVVVDTLKSQFSRFYDHAQRYAEPDYSRKIQSVTATAERLKKNGIISRFIILSERDTQADGITKKFFRGHVRETHDFRGAPITAYLVGLNACNTTYAVHYDGDILLHQAGAGDWVTQGIHEIKSNAGLIAASPRPAPTLQSFSKKYDDVCWFSTRCLLVDVKRLFSFLPLARGNYLAELYLRKFLKKTYPPAFETMLTRCLSAKGLKTRYLLNNDAWYLHPEDKGVIFNQVLPAIIGQIKQGNFPPAQADTERLLLDEWVAFCNAQLL